MAGFGFFGDGCSLKQWLIEATSSGIKRTHSRSSFTGFRRHASTSSESKVRARYFCWAHKNFAVTLNDFRLLIEMQNGLLNHSTLFNKHFSARRGNDTKRTVEVRQFHANFAPAQNLFRFSFFIWFWLMNYWYSKCAVCASPSAPLFVFHSSISHFTD